MDFRDRLAKVWANAVAYYKEEFDLFPYYWTAMADQWNGIVWGTGPVFLLLFGVWLSLGAPPVKLLTVGVVWALMVAGYYVWRADHLRLMPKLEFFPEVLTQWRDVKTIEPPIEEFVASFIQLLPQCTTESIVRGCRGRLLRVLKWDTGRWKETPINEPLDLIWSYHDSQPRTLEPGIEQRLNVLSVTPRGVELQVDFNPRDASRIFVAGDDFRLDVIVTSDDCPPIRSSIKFRIGAKTSERLPLPVGVGLIDATEFDRWKV